ncbi:terpene synthase family protein [Streptomyces monomycini]|uniref:terpene synthase family protein n=1 Tax=Streptomyces monomycini TaxID=371720 RepID=UPI0004AB4805|nr:hypothetical protein [Streptomyces monomycini]
MDTSNSYELPPFWTPHPARLHPAADVLEQHSLRWMTQLDFFGEPGRRKTMAAARSGLLAAYLTPGAPVDRVQLYADLICWLHCFDDCHVDDPQWEPSRLADLARRTGTLVRALQNPGTPLRVDDPFVAALVELSERFRSAATPAQHKRWREGFAPYFSAHLWLLSHHVNQTRPTLDEYLALRTVASGTHLVAYTHEIVNGPEIAVHEWALPPLWACVEIAYAVGNFDNDIVSRAKEVQDNETGHNLVDIVAVEQNLPLSEALRAAMAMRDRMLARFLVQYRLVRPLVSPSAARCLDDWAGLPAGALEMQRRSPRYAVNGHTGIRYTDTPSDTSIEPLPYSSVAWWWETLDNSPS